MYKTCLKICSDKEIYIFLSEFLKKLSTWSKQISQIKMRKETRFIKKSFGRERGTHNIARQLISFHICDYFIYITSSVLWIGLTSLDIHYQLSIHIGINRIKKNECHIFTYSSEPFCHPSCLEDFISTYSLCLHRHFFLRWLSNFSNQYLLNFVS